MNRSYKSAVLGALAALLATSAFANPGLQVTTCSDLGGGVWRYTFFACAPNINANDLHVRLLASEITQGEAIVGCSVPALAGFSCSFTATEATYVFPTIGPFECVPALPGDINKFVVDIATPDAVSQVDEIWTLDGVELAGFTTSITCPPVSVESESWGRIKATYQ